MSLPGYDPARRVLSKDQLKSKKSAPYPLPDELKNAYKKAVTGLRNGEDGILVPLKETPQHMLAVSQKDLNAPKIHEKIVRLAILPEMKKMDFGSIIYLKKSIVQIKCIHLNQILGIINYFQKI